MRYIGIILVIFSFPVFMSLLRSGPIAQKWAFIVLGAAPVIGTALNTDAAFISWAHWPGHTKGIIISLTDTLALAICVHFRPRNKYPLLLWFWVLYIICNVPGLLLGSLFTPGLFYLVSLLKAALYFLACYIVMSRGAMSALVSGLCIAVIANSGMTISNFLQGVGQPGGLVGHRNYAGLINNLAIPLLLVDGTFGRLKLWRLLAIGMAAVAAILGGSRAVIVLFGASVYLTLFCALVARPSKQIKYMLAMCVLASFLAVPAGLQKLRDRSEDGSIMLSKDAERTAFEKAAQMMIKDHPLGIGLNQYANLANVGGYSAAAGVNWMSASKSAIVHNSYVLVRTEGGLIAQFAMLLLLASTLVTSTKRAFKPTASPARVFAVPALVATLILSIHLSFEWAFVTMNNLYSFALITALASFVTDVAQKDIIRKGRDRALIRSEHIASALIRGSCRPKTYGHR